MTEQRLRLIRFVTGHYSELRGGVTRAALAPIVMAVGFAGDVFAGSFAFILVNVTFVVGVSNVLNRWMDRRFGRVVAGVNHQRLVVTVCVVAFFVTMRLDNNAAGMGRPSLLFLAAAVYGLWLLVRLWPFAIHNLLPVAVAVVVAVTFGGVYGRDEFVVWERYAYALTLLAWTMAGLIDLALLMRALPHRPDSPDVVNANVQQGKPCRRHLNILPRSTVSCTSPRGSPS
jgi:hypothetical protein